MKAADAKRVAMLLREAFAEFRGLYTRQAFGATAPGAAAIQRRLSEGPVWIAELDDQIIGTISGILRDDGLYLRSMAVVPSARRSGAARLLLQTVEEFAITHHAPRIYCSTTPFLTAAIGLYDAAGYVRTAAPPHELLGTPLFTMEKRIGLRPEGDRPSASVITLDTGRLRLRTFRPDDIDAYAAMCADPEVMRYVGDRGPLSRDDAWRQMAMLLGHWQLRGFGMWAVEERSTGVLVGRVGLHYPEGWPEPELAWALASHFWGRGFAYEAAQASLAHAFTTLGWPRAISLIDPANARSVRLAQRLGERLERRTTLRGHGVDLYAIDASAWSPG